MRRYRDALVGAWVIAIVAWSGAASPRSALGSDDSRLQVRRTETVSWLDAAVEEDIETVTIRILAPDEQGDRFLYQRCRLSYSGAGDYSCGVDAEAMKEHPGEWAATLALDGDFHDRERFSSEW